MPPYILLCFLFLWGYLPRWDWFLLGIWRQHNEECLPFAHIIDHLPADYQCCIRGRLSRDEAETETWLSETETQALRDWDETETWISVTETRPRPLKNFTFLCVYFFHLLNLLWPFWGIHTVDSRYNKLLGPSEITLLYQNFVISGLQNNNIQRNFELWDQENYFVMSDFVISVFFITRVPLYIPCRCLAQALGRDIET